MPALIAGGWYLVQRPLYECRNDDVPGQLSAGATVFSLFIEEHVMVARLECWEDGKRLWSVLHNWQEAEEHLETDRELPAEFPSIRDEIMAVKGHRPFFEIPSRC
ncbi:MAG TPA: hypothetical protein VMH30_04515 [Verrucomicrobiae bacterium]|nr:hypothetical protein [Verrucomicrobiae bacterium]